MAKQTNYDYFMETFGSPLLTDGLAKIKKENESTLNGDIPQDDTEQTTEQLTEEQIIENYKDRCFKHTMLMTWGVFFGVIFILTLIIIILDSRSISPLDWDLGTFPLWAIFTITPAGVIALWTNTKSHYDNAKYAEENNIECERAEKEWYKYKVGLVASATCTAGVGKSAGRGIKNTFKPSKK